MLRSTGSATLPLRNRSPREGGRSSPARLRQPGHRLRRCLRCLRRQYDLPPAYCAARLLCRLIFDLPINSPDTR
ncbi:MAG: hypothetical protein WCL49_13360, partial [bacterium]